MPEARRRAHVPDTDWKLRTRAEQDAIFVLDQSISHHIRDALKAGLVERWLAHYPFANSTASHSSSPGRIEQAKHETFNRVRLGYTDDTSLGGILRTLYSSPYGRRQLREHKLIGSVIEEVSLVEVEAARDGADVQRRERSDSEGELSSVRRRNRQAMVISDGEEPITRDNIYQGPAAGGV